MTETGPILVGVSTCLVGEKVRWDGDHRHDRYLTDTLGRHLELVPVCPEAELGMGVPREPIHLEGDPAAPRLVGNESGEDWTQRMNRWSRRKVNELAALGLAGHVLKRRSPSCGPERVPVADGRSRKTGAGLFAAALRQRLPHLPVIEDEQLHNPDRRENFIVRVLAYHRLQLLFAGRWKHGDVAAFHARQTCLLLAHSPRHTGKLDRLVAQAKDLTRAGFRDRYVGAYLAVLQVRSTVPANAKVLRSLLDRLEPLIGKRERADILRIITNYRRGRAPLIAPLTLLDHYLQLHGLDDLLAQQYLRPAPVELA